MYLLIELSGGRLYVLGGGWNNGKILLKYSRGAVVQENKLAYVTAQPKWGTKKVSSPLVGISANLDNAGVVIRHSGESRNPEGISG
jgi:hypothetical protein